LKPEALRFNFEFTRVYRRGKVAAGRYVTVHCMKRYPGVKQSGYKVNPEVIRPGFCVSKKGIGAVGRNRVRRLMREVYRSDEDMLPGGIDIVFTYRNKGDIPTYAELKSDIDASLHKLKLTVNEDV